MVTTEPVDILLVDDQPSRLLTYEAILAPLGHRFVTAASGVEALQRIMEREFAVILLDVSMPEMDGFETARTIHGHPRFQSTPIIFVTGIHLSELDRLKGYEVGAVDYVYVPVVPEILRSKVAVLVELHCQRLELKRLNSSLQEANRKLDAANRKLQREKESELAKLNEQLQKSNRDLLASNAALKAEVEQRSLAEKALLDADRRKDDFLAILAHELRNPLAPISNAIEILQRLGPKDTELVRMRDLIDRQVRHMTRLVDDLLDVARITQGKIHLRSEPLELGELVRRATEAQAAAAAARGHRLDVNLPGTPVEVIGDAVRITQVIGNLVSNAIKYTPDGGRLEVSLVADDGRAAVSVRDNGIGIDGEYLSHVFDLFGQVKYPRPREHTHDGLGIGLALVQRLIEMHQGEVEARSDGAGLGSEFIVRLPLRVGERVATSAPTGLLPRETLAGRRILVVDDAEDCRESLGEVLRIAGGEVRTAVDGPSGIEAAAQFDPEIVLLDIRMPKMDGYETARHLRASPRGDRLYLIALTGWGQPEHVEKSRLAGFDEHMTKPVEVETLLARIARLKPREQTSQAVAATA
ncbi:MAG TPA: response regulator [Steroidobacteraceae bacterium]|nr:response regulator [Steroidobacteraceae bacterium]